MIHHIYMTMQGQVRAELATGPVLLMHRSIRLPHGGTARTRYYYENPDRVRFGGSHVSSIG